MMDFLTCLLLVFMVSVNSNESYTAVEEVIRSLCTAEKTQDIQIRFKICSHSTNSNAFKTIKELTSVKNISEELCKALTTIGTVCMKHFRECYPGDNLTKMRKVHLEEMKMLLLQIRQDKVPSNAIDNCKILRYVEKETDFMYLKSESKQSKVLAEIFIDLAVKACPVIFAIYII